MGKTLFDVIDLLNIQQKASISITGGGGKTTLMGVLGAAFLSLGFPVLLTTTTKIQNPFPFPVDWFVAERDMEVFEKKVLSRLEQKAVGLGVGGTFGDHKWDGITSEAADHIFEKMGRGILLNEADGAKRLPIKAPGEGEPVIPPSTTHLIPVIGLSALGNSLDETHAFRPQLISKITGQPLGDTITEMTLAPLFTHPEGVSKGAPPKAKILPFLNQADNTSLKAAGRRIAEGIFLKSSQINSVLVGTLKPMASFDICQRGG